MVDNDFFSNLHLLFEGKPILNECLLGMGLLFIDRCRDPCQGIWRDHTPNSSRANATEDENAFKHDESPEKFATVY